ncbi:MAG: phosphatidylglycerophosphatase A [Kangiellaceae bacterium]|nr:phosphatidylglycerophosphatase A [Kangiellaceae bacterium]
MQKIPAKAVFSNPINFLAVGFGSGLSPKAPGTMGTIACVPLYLFASTLDLYSYLAVCLLISITGIWICNYTANYLNTHDHPGIVWDEFAGFFITMIAVPMTWQNLIIGFALFRIFDILKPWPISWLDKKVSGGFGIMIDDVVAGLFALSVLQLLLFYNSSPI